MEEFAYIAALEKRPVSDYVREVEALEEVITYPEEVQQARYDTHCDRLTSGKPRATATTDELPGPLWHRA